MTFPIDLASYRRVRLDPARSRLELAERADLEHNIALCRDAIVFFTAVAAAKGLGGHTGGAYDVVPEAVLADALQRGDGRLLPVLFDEAGHRVALQYLFAVLRGDLEAERLLHYREAGAGLPGHPERGLTPGIAFSSGRLGHLWPYVNGVAMAHPGRRVLLLGSDGSQQEGTDAEAARLAVARGLEVKLLIDDNDVTIAGHPSEYLPGFDVGGTLEALGLFVRRTSGEDLEALYDALAAVLAAPGPAAVVSRRPMAPGIAGLEGSPKAHDVIAPEAAAAYLRARGREEAAEYLAGVARLRDPSVYLGSSREQSKNRDLFGRYVCELLEELAPEERGRRVRVFDNDLEGSCGLHHIRKAFPELYVRGGVMERGNFSAAAGFGSEPGRQGVFGTFSAFLEMVVSEITMARLNDANVLAHFSHAGVDWMADNTCHFGLNNFFADNGLEEGDRTRLYFPADRHQLRALLRAVFWDPGLRFVFSTRSGTPDILDGDGTPLFAGGYAFTPGRDDLVREGAAGYVVSYGEMLYRALDAVERLRAEGLDVGLVNKATLNVPDEEMLARIGRAPFVLVVESQNRRTGLGVRFGTWLLERGFAPRYAHLGSHRIGCGGLWEQLPHQGLDSASIRERIRALAG